MVWRKNWIVWSWERKAEKIPVKKRNGTKERRNSHLLVKEEEMKWNGENEKQKEKNEKWKERVKKKWLIKKSNKILKRYYSQEKQIKENCNERSKKEKK